MAGFQLVRELGDLLVMVGFQLVCELGDLLLMTGFEVFDGLRRWSSTSCQWRSRCLAQLIDFLLFLVKRLQDGTDLQIFVLYDALQALDLVVELAEVAHERL